MLFRDGQHSDVLANVWLAVPDGLKPTLCRSVMACRFVSFCTEAVLRDIDHDRANWNRDALLTLYFQFANHIFLLFRDAEKMNSQFAAFIWKNHCKHSFIVDAISSHGGTGKNGIVGDALQNIEFKF